MKLAISKQSETRNFTHYVEQNMSALKSYCRSLTQKHWDADDLVQETLLKAFNSWKRQPRELSKAFFIRIASNTWIDQYRKRSVAIEGNQDIQELKCETDEDRDDRHHILQEVMKTLTPKQRTAILLIEGLGLSAGETAEVMEESVGAVKATLHRARKKLINFEKETVSDSDDDSMMPYIDALNEGSPEHIVQLYRQDAGVPMMSLSNGGTPAGSLAYVLITIQLKNGKQLTIPFYRKEWLALFSNMEEGFESYALIA